MRDSWQLRLGKLFCDRISIYQSLFYINLQTLSQCYGTEHCLEYSSSKMLRYYIHLDIAMVTGLFFNEIPGFYVLCSRELLRDKEFFFFFN